MTIDPPDQTVVDRQDDFNLDGHRLLIVGLDKEQLSSPNDSNVSYDLRVGAEYRDHREEGKRYLKNGDSLILRPGAALIVQTEEYIHLPKTMYGIIAPKVSKLEEGISNTFSKVDPGYHGYLLISIFNLGKSSIELRRGDRFCALTVLDLRGEARPYNKGPKGMGVGSALSKLQRFSDLLEAYSGYLHLLEIIATAILIVATLLLAFSHFLQYSRH